MRRVEPGDILGLTSLGESIALLEYPSSKINLLHMHLQGTKVFTMYIRFLFSSFSFLVKIS